MVQTLVKMGTDVNTQKNGLTALMWASTKGHFDVMQMLVKAGAGIDLKNKEGQTALDIVKEQNKKEIEAFLTSRLTRMLSGIRSKTKTK